MNSNNKPYLDGWYKGIYCQSVYELIWVAHAIHVSKIRFERNKNKFPYEFEGTTEQYIPDFILEDGTYVELKGKFDDREYAKWRYFRKSNILKVYGWKELKVLKEELQTVVRFGDDVASLYENKEDSQRIPETRIQMNFDKSEQKKAKFFAFDTETGGLDPTQFDLLTFHGIFLDENLDVIDEIGFSIKPEDGKPYRISIGAMQTNKINLVDHDKIAVPPSVAGALLKQKFIQVCGNPSKFSTRLYGVGQNLSFDYGFIKQLGKENYDQFLNNGCMDLYTLSLSLQAMGLLPSSLRLKLEPLCQFFGINATFHNAKEDIHATVKVVKFLFELMKEYVPKIDKKFLEKRKVPEMIEALSAKEDFNNEQAYSINE